MSEGREGFAEIRATYRLQFHRDFTLAHATSLVPYLASLGISHVYASPIMEARPGSTHGYDIIDHNRLNPEIGSAAEFAAFVDALHRHGMGLVLDFVPNHMGVAGGDNMWWNDVLEWGEESPFAPYFDINWDALRADLKGRVLLPVLGNQYGAILEAGEITLAFDGATGNFSACYFDHRFPLSPHSYAAILEAGGLALSELAQAFATLRGGAAGRGPKGVDGMRERAAALKGDLARRAGRDAAVGDAIDRAIAAFSGRKGRPSSFRRLHRLLEAQAYRLAYWRVAAEEINYRRFFNINDLAGLRMELPQLFEETHRLAFAMLAEGAVDGLRIDHIDGLFDPATYCNSLQAHAARPLYILVEKILAHYESMPDWPIAGSTGYDFVNQVLALFVDAASEGRMTRLYRRLIGRVEDFDAVLYQCKQRIMRVNLASEMNVLARRFHRLSMSQWSTRDFTLNGMLAALEEVVAAFPVYRTYVSERGVGSEDRRYIDWAIGRAKKRAHDSDTTIIDFVHSVLTLNLPGHPRPEEVTRTAAQFQQVTGPVMAKSFEDTAFYRYFRLLALNEVGGDPRRFGTSVAAFHRAMQERARDWPRAMLTTATHDTKRGEDGRIRIALISEMPGEWGRRVTRWLRLNRRHHSDVDGASVPDRNVEYLFYQSLLGAWPADAEPGSDLAERLVAYMTKAVREGKEESGWSNPNVAYEEALKRFIEGALDTRRANPFLADFALFAGLLARPAAIASLSQLVLKLTAPGIPDIYQGGELWDFSLVDPDNRRPVDWDRRRDLLGEIAMMTAGDLGADWQSGREKLFVTQRLLGLRRDEPALFAAGDYQPLEVAGGDGSEPFCVFSRRQGDRAIAVVVPRLVYRLYGGSAAPGDARIALPPGASWRDIFTGRTQESGETIAIAELLARFPVAVLVTAPS